MKHNYGSGDIENEDKQRYHSFMRHSSLSCSIILSSIIKIFLTVAELCSGNELLTPARPTTSWPALVILIA